MKAYEIASYDGLDSVLPVDLPKPIILPGQVLVHMRAASMNYRDLMVAHGTYPLDKTKPVIPLSDGVGEVIEVGDGVVDFKRGDRVMGTFFHHWEDGELTSEEQILSRGGGIDGVLAEYVAFHDFELVHVPDYLTNEEASTLPCAAVTAWQGLVNIGQIKAGDTVLTLGTGGVSLFALQIAKMHGARVIITSSSDEKLKLAKNLGADDGINYVTCPNWESAVLDLTNGRGVDHVVELGGAGTLQKSLQAIRLGGKIAVIGGLSSVKDHTPVARQILFRLAKVTGILVASRQTLREMNKAFECNKLKPVIDKVFSFDHALDAYRHMKSGEHFGKIVIRY